MKHRLDIRQFLAQHFDLQLVLTVIACFSDLRKQLTVPLAESVDFLAHLRSGFREILPDQLMRKILQHDLAASGFAGALTEIGLTVLAVE